MGREHEAVVLSFLDALVAGDPDRALECFAPDAAYHVSAWQGPVVGREAIRSELARQAGIYTDFTYEVVNIASTDTVVLTERVDSMRIGEKPVSLHWAGVHEVAGGKITSARDYYDMKELEARLGG